MILAANSKDGIAVLMPEKGVPKGSEVL